MENLTATIGPALLHARSRRHFTQHEVAERLRINPAYYGRIERGHALPSVPTLYKLVRLLDVSADELLGLAETPVIAPSRKTTTRDPHRLRRDPAALRRIMSRMADSKPHTVQLILQLIKVLEGLLHGGGNTDRAR